MKHEGGGWEVMFTIINPVYDMLANLVISCKLDLNTVCPNKEL